MGTAKRIQLTAIIACCSLLTLGSLRTDVAYAAEPEAVTKARLRAPEATSLRHGEVHLQLLENELAILIVQ
jgi:hypothetical protein